MALTLPADIEPYVGRDFSTPAVYALILTLPHDFRAAWDRRYDVVPGFVERAAECDTVLYVGATGNLIGRLEDHKLGGVRNAALVSLAEDVALADVWPYDDTDRAFERESGIAMEIANDTDTNTYVHQR